MERALRMIRWASILWVLVGIPAVAHASAVVSASSPDLGAALHVHEDAFQAPQSLSKDLSPHLFWGVGPMGRGPSTAFDVVCVQGTLERPAAPVPARKLYLFFPTGLSPPASYAC